MNENKDFNFEEEYKSINLAKDKGFFETSFIIRMFIGFSFLLVTFAALHFSEIRLDIPEVGSLSKSSINAKTDFEFFDDETSNILKEESIRDIGHIYKLDKDQVANLNAEFRTYLFSKDWRKYLETTTFEEVWQAGILLTDTLNKVRFTDARTYQKMKEVGYSYRYFHVFSPPLDKIEEVVFPERVWEPVASLAFAEKIFQSDTLDFVIEYFRKKKWQLQNDYNERAELKNQVKQKIQPFKSRVKSGDRILEEKERVSSRHVAMLQAMKKAMAKEKKYWHFQTQLGSFIMTIVYVGIVTLYLRRHHPEVYYSNRKFALVISVIALTIMIAKLTELFLLNTSNEVIEKVRYPLFAPFAAILICCLLNQRVAYVVSIFVSTILMMGLSAKQNGFFPMNLVMSFGMILSTKTLRRRQEIFIISIKGWMASLLCIMGLNFHDPSFDYTLLFYDCLSSLSFVIITAILVVGILSVFESIFGIMTDITLMEYMDPNQDLLRRLSIEAPGTYQHSLVVGSLSEAAAVAIGANGLFCRVATMYHDIGKLVTPQYFTENYQGDVNIHQLLTPKESAQVIIAHVSEGITMSRKASLPEQFVDIIKEHHGTTLVYYFYHKHKESVGQERALEDIESFRYTGPKPKTKESAIIMIADTIEAASRCLEEFTEEAVSELVIRLVKEKAEDGQFDECYLTFEELGIVQSVMIKTLVAAGHSRVRYPKREKQTKVL